MTGNLARPAIATLVVRLKIPFDSDPPTGLIPALTFSQWLPTGGEHAIHAVQDEMELTLWFDEKCTWWASQPTAEDIKKWANVQANYVNADVTLRSLPSDLASYMQKRDFSRPPSESEAPLQAAYERLSQLICAFVLSKVNRLIAYARSKKGQFWISELEFDGDRVHSLLNQFEARGQVDGGAWFRFQGAAGDRITVTSDSGNRYITEAEWQALRQFVEGEGRPGLIGALLAGAEHLWKVGHRRGALTEAVTALEIALYAFARSPKADAAFGGQLSARLSISTLLGQVDHLGLSGSIRYLLPTILSADILPDAVLRGCQAAVDQRQNVVHNGQRDVSDGSIRGALQDIRQCCDILESLSNDSSE